MAIQGYLAWPSRRIRRQRLSEERLRRRDATIPTQQKINALALLTHSSVEMVPFASNGNVRLIYPPRRVDAACMPIPALLELGNKSNDPSQNRRVRDLNIPLRHHRHEISIAQPVGDVPAKAQPNHVGIEGAAAVHGDTINWLGHSKPPPRRGRILRERPQMHRNLSSE